MLDKGGLDRKTKGLIAMAVSLVNGCDYCSLAHGSVALMSGARQDEINDTKKVI
ncbi:MAG: carboxymuconolactone decarboxylase family protein [Desulfobacterales bacterium]|nr:carboxymuconolactone decarboxylase family protein [Desulfobacterales bacterium]